MATKDKIVNLEDLKVLSDHVEGEVTDLKSDLSETKDTIFVKKQLPVDDWAQGGNSPTNGSTANNSKMCRTGFIFVNDDYDKVIWSEAYKVRVLVYESNTITSYIGGADGFADFNVFDGRIKNYRGKYIRLNVMYASGEVITPSDVTDINIITETFTDTTLTMSGKAADAKVTGEALDNIVVDVNVESWTIGKYINPGGALLNANNGAVSVVVIPNGYTKIRNDGASEDANGNTYALNVAQYTDSAFISRTLLGVGNSIELDPTCTRIRFSLTKFHGSDRPDISQEDIDYVYHVTFNGNLNNAYSRLDALEKNVADYSGKRISILGDSISTFVLSSEQVDGKAPEGCTTNYPGNVVQYQNSDVTNVSTTWWGQVIDHFNMVLGINESWAGSCIGYNPNQTASGKYTEDNCLCSATRIGHLGENGTPDIIIVFGGTNDINHHRVSSGSTIRYAVGELDSEHNPYDFDNFPMITDTYYGSITTMLLRIQHAYPNATILMLLPYFCTYTHTSSGDIATPQDQNAWCNVAIDVCKFLGVDYLDLRTIINLYDVSTLLFDGLHPKANGMEAIAKAVIHKLNNML